LVGLQTAVCAILEGMGTMTAALVDSNGLS